MRRLSPPWLELPNCANISGDFPEKVPNGWLPIYGSLQVIPSGTTHTFKHFQSSLKCRNPYVFRAFFRGFKFQGETSLYKQPKQPNNQSPEGLFLFQGEIMAMLQGETPPRLLAMSLPRACVASNDWNKYCPTYPSLSIPKQRMFESMNWMNV